MSIPNLQISLAAQAHVKAATAAWEGDPRDLALALLTTGHALLLILDGRNDHLALYESAARVVEQIKTPLGSA